MKKIIVLIAAVAFTGTAVAQNNILNAKSPEEFGKLTEEQIENNNDTPLPYGYVEQRDVLWQRTVWETIDLDERINFPLYYPVDTIRVGKDRRSLFHVLTDAAIKGDLPLYADSYFNEKREFADIENSLSSQTISEAGINILNDEGIILEEGVRPLDVDTTYNIPGFDQYVNVVTVGADNVKEYRIRGVWYFDARQSELRYRLIGICPVTPDANFMDSDEGVELFWVYYPDARQLLHEAKAFNTLNSARPISFDHILNSRRFNALIYKMDNVQGDREIERYIADNSLMQLLESRRLNEIIRNFELDMWNY
ncbi:gliding motility protein GldO [Nonlabens sp. MIC269]|uniref:type IX secretion system ring protein PorN/GldN n=1 Tax=Nonlabens sp. MIC269 TaxID=1476901 RepID=UPI00072070DC|nr:gliding motility protein GldN [Nonlabens sp. MIC269]ALM21823.1 gliding motility protein GldO [Nonlabens sp. MIC269]